MEVPAPESVILARGRDAAGVEWCQVAARGIGHWWQPAQGGKQILGKVDVVDVLAIQVREGEGASDSVPRQSAGHSSCATERSAHSAKLRRIPSRFRRCSCLVIDVAVITSSSSVSNVEAILR